MTSRTDHVQHFYNIPPNDPLYQSNITGTHAEDGARDSVGTAWCPGSGFIVRRSALEEIDGFPDFAVVEDLFTSWHLHGKGWQTALVHEELQWGIQPQCFVVHMKQRRRWVSTSPGLTQMFLLTDTTAVDRPFISCHSNLVVFVG